MAKRNLGTLFKSILMQFVEEADPLLSMVEWMSKQRGGTGGDGHQTRWNEIHPCSGTRGKHDGGHLRPSV